MLYFFVEYGLKWQGDNSGRIWVEYMVHTKLHSETTKNEVLLQKKNLEKS